MIQQHFIRLQVKYLAIDDFKHDQKEKVGVLLVNLGTPDQPTPKALRVYLKEFLSDNRVVEIPRLIWWMILNLIILPFRSKRSAQAYQSIWRADGSPLLLNTKALTENVKAALSEHQHIEVDFAMRYGNPSVDSKVAEFQKKGVRKLLTIPLYPQYSATTTASTFDAIAQSFRKRRLIPELRFVNHYHDSPLYIKALADKVRGHWQEHGKPEKLVLSFHGIPKRNWHLGDPYACECHKTSRLLIEALQHEYPDAADIIMTTFQSRFGKAEWIKPYTDATLKQLAAGGTKSVQVMCPGFAVDCLETLEEIAEENREYFVEAGGEHFSYIECLNDDAAHTGIMLDIVNNNIQGWAEQLTDNDEAALQQRLNRYENLNKQ